MIVSTLRLLTHMPLLVLMLGCHSEVASEMPASEESPTQPQPHPEAKYAEYAGTFIAGPLATLEIEAVENWLYLDPPSWTGRPYFLRAEVDIFTMALPYQAPDRSMTFFRDGAGSVIGVELANLDPNHDAQRFRRLHDGDKTPALLFLDGQPEAAARAALADRAITPDELHRFAIAQFTSHPTRHAETVALLEVLSHAHPEHARLMALYGYSLVSVNRRGEARQVLERALRLDPEEPNAKEALRRLTPSNPPAGEGHLSVLPFSLAEAYAPPSAKEIAQVRQVWAEGDLSPRDVETVQEFELRLEYGVFAGKILRHRVHDDVHYGAVLVPQAQSGPLPVLLEGKGVDPAYSPRDISQGTGTLSALGAAQTGFIVVIPALRGNRLILDGKEFASSGDASDAWDGATDDTLALLQVALESTPEADPERIAIIGTSRGGTVALLAAAREPRISLVLNLMGPVDHFEAMTRTEGWTKAEVLADTLADGLATEDEEGHQTFDHFFDRVLSDGETLEDVRRRLIASSPLYFVETLPETHSYYGAEDRSVPLANPRMLEAELKSQGRLGPEMTLTVIEDGGHDGDSLLLLKDTARRLVEWARRMD